MSLSLPKSRTRLSTLSICVGRVSSPNVVRKMRRTSLSAAPCMPREAMEAALKRNLAMVPKNVGTPPNSDKSLRKLLHWCSSLLPCKTLSQSLLRKSRFFSSATSRLRAERRVRSSEVSLRMDSAWRFCAKSAALCARVRSSHFLSFASLSNALILKSPITCVHSIP